MEDWVRPLRPLEELAIARAVPRRRREFAAGRAAARQALSEAGAAQADLPRRADGPPVWPSDYTGSITHSEGHVIAVAGRLGPNLRAIGLDLESAAPLPLDLSAQVCRDDEDRSQAIAIFSAKEAAYKAQFMLTGQLLDHCDLRVSFGASGEFVAEFMVAAGSFRSGDQMSGSQKLLGSLILSAVRIS